MFCGVGKHRRTMPGSTFLLAQAQAPDTPRLPASYRDSSTGCLNRTWVPALPPASCDDMVMAARFSTQPPPNLQARANLEHEAKLDNPADKVDYSPLEHSGIRNECAVQHPCCHSCGSVAKPVPVQEAARLLQRRKDTSEQALQCMDRLKNGVELTSGNGNALPAHESGWHKDYFMFFKPCKTLKTTISGKSVEEMQEMLQKETEKLLETKSASGGKNACIYELKCHCDRHKKYFCDVQDRESLGLERKTAKRTMFQDKKRLRENFWWMFAAIEWEEGHVGVKRKKTT